MLAKGKLYISKDKLKELFNIDKDVKVIVTDVNIFAGGIEIDIVADKAIEKLTVEITDDNEHMNIRRRGLPLENRTQEGAEPQDKKFFNLEQEKEIRAVFEEAKKVDAEKLIKEIFNQIRKKGN